MWIVQNWSIILEEFWKLHVGSKGIFKVCFPLPLQAYKCLSFLRRQLTFPHSPSQTHVLLCCGTGMRGCCAEQCMQTTLLFSSAFLSAGKTSTLKPHPQTFNHTIIWAVAIRAPACKYTFLCAPLFFTHLWLLENKSLVSQKHNA